MLFARRRPTNTNAKNLKWLAFKKHTCNICALTPEIPLHWLHILYEIISLTRRTVHNFFVLFASYVENHKIGSGFFKVHVLWEAIFSPRFVTKKTNKQPLDVDKVKKEMDKNCALDYFPGNRPFSRISLRSWRAQIGGHGRQAEAKRDNFLLRACKH